MLFVQYKTITPMEGPHNSQKQTCLFATLWRPNVLTRIVKPDIFDIVGTGLLSPRGENI